jgi:hypothetical protein
VLCLLCETFDLFVDVEWQVRETPFFPSLTRRLERFRCRLVCLRSAYTLSVILEIHVRVYIWLIGLPLPIST